MHIHNNSKGEILKPQKGDGAIIATSSGDPKLV